MAVSLDAQRRLVEIEHAIFKSFRFSSTFMREGEREA